MLGSSISAQSMKRSRWQFWVQLVGVLALAYFVGYFVLMDRHRPTSPAGAYGYFQSSFRWARNEVVHKSVPPQVTPYPNVTILNVIYRPMDSVYFRFFPRFDSEIDHLQSMGYFR
jgi:hypothetical protein